MDNAPNKKRDKKKKARQKKRQHAAMQRDQESESDQEDDIANTESNETASKKKFYGVWTGTWPNSDNTIPEKSTPIEQSVDTSSIAFRLQHLPKEEPQIESPPVEPLPEPNLQTETKTPKEKALELTKIEFTKAGEKSIPEPSQPPKKQHTGLRCKKCFALLARDTDFEYRNGSLFINPELHKDKTWQGLVIQKGNVYCQNMHIVGYREESSWTNTRLLLTVLKTNKTTFIENFVNNPQYEGSDLTKNKLRFSNMVAPENNPWKKMLELEGLDPNNIVPDRYHKQ